MTRFKLFVVLTLAGLTAVSAQEAPAALQGRSMIGDRIERITFGNWSFDQHWVIKLYFARDGRIFAKQTLNSGNPNNGSGTLALISDQGTSVAPFTWNGANASRQWTNLKNGVVLTLVLSPGPNGQSCTMDLDRQNVRDFSVHVLKQSCRIFVGNAAAD